MRHDLDSSDESLIACGDHARKKIGQVWMCDYHFATFQHVEDYTHGELKSAMDSSTAKE
jgi:hypothetical protein